MFQFLWGCFSSVQTIVCANADPIAQPSLCLFDQRSLGTRDTRKTATDQQTAQSEADAGDTRLPGIVPGTTCHLLFCNRAVSVCSAP